MSDPDPEAFDLTESFESALADAPADERVYRVALELYESATIADIAERASCATDTARRHLQRLVEIGVIEQTGEHPATYRRNESYFEWRKRHRLTKLSLSELQARLETLLERDRTFQNRYDADSPTAVDALDHASPDELDEVWLDLSEWETIRRRIERLETVRQQHRNRSSRRDSEAA